MGRKKDYSELTFTDDFMFCKILSTNLDLCKELLELILRVKIQKVVVSESQKTLQETYRSKGVRLDVYVEDEKNTIYNIEMQTTMQKFLPKRMRYYQGMIDMHFINSGEGYYKLKQTYIIFICQKSPYKKSNLPIYTFDYMCRESNNIKLEDAATKVIINAAGNRNGLSSDMCAFLDYLKTGKATSKLTQTMQYLVEKEILNEEWRDEYMSFDTCIVDARCDEAIEAILLFQKISHASNEDAIEAIRQRLGVSKKEAEELYYEYAQEEV